jgi:phosphoribosylformimino-5-aminoimidazole carboxamide ribotide isomerase
MIAIPAIDLRGGACVQLVGGSPDAERIRLADPIAVARGWSQAGFSRLHVVDLDAALGSGSNAAMVRDIVAATQATTQVGGGIRGDERIAEIIEDGADFVILGTRAVEDRAWLAGMAARYPGRLLVAVDVRDRRVVVRGWVDTLPLDVLDVVQALGVLPLGGILVTAVHREGQMGGPDMALMEDVVRVSALPVHAAGGIAALEDLRRLADCGVTAAVIGMALYTGALEPRAVAQEFGE